MPKNFTNNDYRRATALVLVVVLLALLAIMGTSFVIMSRVEKVAAENQASRGEIDRAADSLVEVIKTTLSEDLWGDIDANELQKVAIDPNAMKQQRLLGLPCDSTGNSNYGTPTYPNWPTGANPLRNEPWDAAWTPPAGAPVSVDYPFFTGGVGQPPHAIPVDGDSWLANSDPAVGQRTNLFSQPWPAGTNPIGWDVTVVPAAYVNSLQADADGDGTADAIWLVQNGAFYMDPSGSGFVVAKNQNIDPNNNPPVGIRANLPFQASSSDQAYRIAVRIVDTSGMINVNTAWHTPTDIGPADNFSGEALSGINLYSNGLIGYTQGTSSTLPGRLDNLTDNATTNNCLGYQDSYIFRIENPLWGAGGLDLANANSPFYGFYPLDLSDELALRHEWNVKDAHFTSSLERIFPTVATTAAARPRLTAYSFTRNIRRNMQLASPAGNTAGNKFLDYISAVDNISVTGRDYTGFYPRKVDIAKCLQQWLLYVHGVAITQDNQRYFNALPLALFEAFRAGQADVDGAGAIVNPQLASYLSAQYIANLVDALDNDTSPTIITATDINQYGPLLPDWGATVGQTTTGGIGYVAGLERFPAITEAYAYRVRDPQNPADTSQDQYGFELYNQWGTQIDISVADPVSGSITPLYYYSVDGGTNIYPISPSAAASIPPHGFLPIVTPTLVSSLTVANCVVPPTSMVFQDNSQIIIYRRVATPGIPSGVIAQDNFKITNLGTADPGDGSTNPIQFGYTWNSIRRDTDTSWIAFADHQVNPGSTSLRAPQASPPPPPSGYQHSLGLSNGALWAQDTQFSLWFDDSLDYNAWSILGNQQQLDEIQKRVSNLERLSLVWYLGNLPGDGSNLLVRPLSFRLTSRNRTAERGFRFDYAAPLGLAFADYFETLGRSSDGIDQLATGTADTLNEMRLPGLINVNTAPAEVLQALHPFLTPAQVQLIIQHRPYTSVGDILTKANLTALPPGYTCYTAPVIATGDLNSAQATVTRLSSLLTVRSDTFAAYILIQQLDRNGNVVAQRRELALFDRSLCNQPPLIWNNNQWAPNPSYTAPKVVARTVVE